MSDKVDRHCSYCGEWLGFELDDLGNQETCDECPRCKKPDRISELELKNEKLRGIGASGVVGKGFHDGVVKTLEHRIEKLKEEISNMKIVEKDTALNSECDGSCGG